AALVGRELGVRGLLARRQHGRGHQREDGEREAEQPQNQDREVLVHWDPFLPCDPFARHIRAAGQRPRQGTYDACVTAPDETPGPGDPKKAARRAKAPAKKQPTSKKPTPRKAAAKKAATPAAAGATA